MNSTSGQGEAVPRRILSVSTHGPLGDAEPASVAHLALAGYLAGHGFVVEVLSGTAFRGGAEVDPAALLGQFDLALEEFQPDLVIVLGVDPLSPEVLKRGRSRGLLTVLMVPEGDARDLSSFALADAVIVPSKFAADYYHEVTGRPCTVIPDMIVPLDVRTEPSEPGYVMFLDPAPRNGLHAFARIADEMGRRRPDIPILVVADPEGKKALDGCGLDLRVHGNVHVQAPPTDPRRRWRRARIALIPSLDWSCPPSTAAEALANGLPVIASDRGSLREVLGDSGVVLPLPDRLTPATTMIPTAEEVSPWVESVVRLWDDDAHASEHRRLAWAEARKWSPEVLGPRYVEFFRDLRRGLAPSLPPPRRSKVVVLVPHLNGIEPACEDGLRQLERAGVRVVRRRGSSQIDVARNEMASDALHEGFESVLFIDADIGFDWRDAVRLLARPEPVISGLYAKKGRRELASIFAKGVGEVRFGHESPGPYPLLFAATGFLRIRTDILRRMVDELDLPHCNLDWGRGSWPFFQPVVVTRPERKPHYLGEDWAFSHRLGQIGVTPLADASIRLWHFGSYGYGWEDAGSDRPRFRNYEFRV